MFAGLFSKEGGFVRTNGDVLAAAEALADAARRGMKVGWKTKVATARSLFGSVKLVKL